MSLDLVVSSNNLSVAWRRSSIATTLASIGLLRRPRVRGLVVGGVVGRTVCRASTGLVGAGSGLAGGAARILVLTVGGDKDVGHALGIPVVATLVFILLFREAGDDIPGVDESRQLCRLGLETLEMARVRQSGKMTYISKNAKENVDEGVGRAKAALHPDCLFVAC